MTETDEFTQEDIFTMARFAHDTGRCPLCCTPLSLDAEENGDTLADCPICGFSAVWSPAFFELF